MTGPNRDWDKEMAEIDKIIAKQPAVPAGKPALPAAGGSVASAPRAASPAPAAPVGRRAVLTTWVRVVLGVLVAVGVTQWPYAHSCGLSLYFYLGATGGVVLAGLWATVTAWKRRMALAHIISLLVTLWGAGLAGKTVLDRSSYPNHPVSWSCR